MSTAFDDRILLHLKRKFSRDEEIGLLVDALRTAQFNNGVLKSELDEVKSERNKLINKVNHLERLSHRRVLPEWDLDAYVQELRNRLAKKDGQQEVRKKDVISWRDKYFSLKAQMEGHVNKIT